MNVQLWLEKYIDHLSIPSKNILEGVAYFVTTVFLEELLLENMRLYPPNPKIPYLKVDNDAETSDHTTPLKNHTKKPLIKELPFDRLEEYQYTEEDRVYGDVDRETTEFYLKHETDNRVDENENSILLGYDEPKPLVQKLVLRVRDK